MVNVFALAVFELYPEVVDSFDVLTEGNFDSLLVAYIIVLLAGSMMVWCAERDG